MHVWLDDSLVDAQEARVSVSDGGLIVGTGVFETMKVVDGTPFALTRHLERLARSAAALDIPVPANDILVGAMDAVISANADAVGAGGRLRLTLTSGPAAVGDPYSVTGAPTLLITLVASKPWPATATVVDSPFARNELGALAGVKSTSYAENAIALRAARRQGADEAILYNTRGQLCEGTGSNVFVVVAGEILTPPLTSGCLDGVTRQLVLEWCGAREAVIDDSVMADATEAFLTSSTRDVHPIEIWGERRFPGVAGKVTAAARRVWQERSADLDP